MDDFECRTGHYTRIQAHAIGIVIILTASPMRDARSWIPAATPTISVTVADRDALPAIVGGNRPLVAGVRIG
jgi:hypothetical protein